MSVQSQEGDTEAAAQASLKIGIIADRLGPCTNTSLLHPLVSCGWCAHCCTLWLHVWLDTLCCSLRADCGFKIVR